jgi:hypothetical protein
VTGAIFVGGAAVTLAPLIALILVFSGEEGNDKAKRGIQDTFSQCLDGLQSPPGIDLEKVGAGSVKIVNVPGPCMDTVKGYTKSRKYAGDAPRFLGDNSLQYDNLLGDTIAKFDQLLDKTRKDAGGK